LTLEVIRKFNPEKEDKRENHER